MSGNYGSSQNSTAMALGVARAAEAAERYEDMAAALKGLVESGAFLAADERGLLSLAYKNLVGARRSSWRVLRSLAAKVEAEEERRWGAGILKAKVEAELRERCAEALALLARLIQSSGTEAEARAFFLKMSGDYRRYVCEIAEGPERETEAGRAEEAYAEAGRVAASLPATSALRLGLALNYSVFLFEIRTDSKAAMGVAKDAFDAAIPHLDALEADAFKEVSAILQLLRDNLSLWALSQPSTASPNDDPNASASASNQKNS